MFVFVISVTQQLERPLGAALPKYQLDYRLHNKVKVDRELGPGKNSSKIEGSDDVQIVDKPGTKSQIWKYFGLHADQNGKPVNNGIAVCQICHSNILAKTGNILNFISHFHLKHPRCTPRVVSSLSPPAVKRIHIRKARFQL